MLFSLLLWCIILFTIITSINSQTETDHHQHVNNNDEIVIFQFVEQSFFELWLNWWAVVQEVGLFKQQQQGGNYSMHLTCYGDSTFIDQMKIFSPSGCDDIFLTSDSPQFKGRIYYAKWSAFVQAFVKHKKNMLLCDIDSVLIRDPRSILFDIPLHATTLQRRISGRRLLLIRWADCPPCRKLGICIVIVC
jgi:hypothetical protein